MCEQKLPKRQRVRDGWLCRHCGVFVGTRHRYHTPLNRFWWSDFAMHFRRQCACDLGCVFLEEGFWCVLHISDGRVGVWS